MARVIGGQSVEDVARARLAARFPEKLAEVTRQLDLAIACADHLRIPLTAELLEELVADHLRAKAAARPPASRTSPAIPLICGDRRGGHLPAG